MQLQSLQEIFNGKYFRIPDYQRGYSWGVAQLNDLWRDITILGEKQDHYTGLLSVVVSDKDPQFVYVVDGQQRLATLIILIHVICKQFSDEEWIYKRKKPGHVEQYLHNQPGAEENEKIVFGYDEDNPSHNHFKTKILEVDNTTRTDQTLYTHNLDQAKEFFSEKINGVSAVDLGVLLKKITEKLKFNYYELDKNLSEFITFETMNNRGKSLSDLELLKNRLIYLSTLFVSSTDEAKDDLRKDINNVWKTVYEFLGKNAEEVLDDNDFLRTHWIMYFGYGGKGKSKVYKDFLLNKHFTVENVITDKVEDKLTLPKITAYVKDMQKVVEHYYYMHNPTHSECSYSDEVIEWLSKLNRLPFGVFKPLVATALTKNVDKASTLEAKTLELLRFAERFLFLARWVRFHRSDKGNASLYELAHKVHRNITALQDENFCMESMRGSSMYVSNVCKKDDFRNKIMDEFDEGFYEWKGLKYFLYEYEICLQKEAKDVEKISWETVTKVNQETIEHIYPKTPKRKWKAFRGRSKKAQKRLHDLGNLLLFPRSKNASISNKPFAEKKDAFKNSSYSAIEVAEYADWTPDTIDTRTEKLLNFLWDRWNIKEE